LSFCYCLSVTAETKQAEKEYLARTGSSAWERVKPFSHPGADTLSDSAQLLHDFSMAMLTLQPSPDDLILDLGAGGCWCSDLLGRLNRRSVAIDISLDMLRAGRSRPTGATIRAVAGDLERLPFRSGAFQKAVCLSAIHHVPDIPKALVELSRVLADDGVAFFSEPGRGHADAPVSTAAMRDFGVLEQDILIEDFAAACRAAGFRDVRVKALGYAVPAFDLTPEDWTAWSRLAASKRPMRAARKLVRVFAELLGVGKKGPLLEEALGMSVVRTLRGAMEDHPILLVSKQPLGASGAGPRWAAEIVIQSAPRGIERRQEGAFVPMTVEVFNRGSAVWKAISRSGTGHVTLGVQILDADGRLLARDHHRQPLPKDVPPGQRVALAFDCPAPREPGRYVLKLDLVAEGVTWFETAGSQPSTTVLEV
jgi:SAM-dependent methyltransferase